MDDDVTLHLLLRNLLSTCLLCLWVSGASQFSEFLVDELTPLLPEQHDLESIKVAQVRTCAESRCLTCPARLLPLTQHIGLGEGLRQGTSTHGSWNIDLDWCEGEVAEWDGLTGDTSESGGTINERAGLIDDINDDSDLTGQITVVDDDDASGLNVYVSLHLDTQQQ